MTRDVQAKSSPSSSENLSLQREQREQREERALEYKAPDCIVVCGHLKRNVFISPIFSSILPMRLFSSTLAKKSTF